MEIAPRVQCKSTDLHRLLGRINLSLLLQGRAVPEASTVMFLFRFSRVSFGFRPQIFKLLQMVYSSGAIKTIKLSIVVYHIFNI